MLRALPDSELILAIDSSLEGTSAMLITYSGEIISYKNSNLGMHCRKMDVQTIYIPLQNIFSKIFSEFCTPFDERQHEVHKRLTKMSLSVAGLDDRFDTSSFVAFFNSVPGLNDVPENIIFRGIGEAAYRAKLYKKPGLMIRCGVGCTVFGCNKFGEKHFTNAWGFVGGDDGSGLSIGQKAVRILARSLDKRATKSESLFADSLFQKLKIYSSVLNFFDSVQRNRFLNLADSASIVTAISHHVFEIASEGDMVAEKILDKVSDEILEGVKAVNKSLKILEDKFFVSFQGGVINHHPAFAKNLFKRICLLSRNAKLLKNEKLPRRIVGTGLIGLGYKDQYSSIINDSDACKKFLSEINKHDYLWEHNRDVDIIC